MQKQNPVDDLFRSGLADFKVTPSDEHREVSIHDAVQEAGQRSTAKWWIVGMGAGLLMIGVGTLINREGQPVKLPQGNKTVTVQKTDVKTIEKNTIEKNAIVSKTEDRIIAKKSGEVKLAALNRTETVSSGMPLSENFSTYQVPTVSINEITETLNETPVKMPEQKCISILPFPDQKPIIESKKPEKIREHHKNDNPPKDWSISAGVVYSPEWMFNTLNGDKFANNMGVEGTFHLGPYSIRTGLGLSITTGSNEKLIQTNSYEGSFPLVDSVVYKWDKTFTNLVPTVYTKGTNVYDTALHYNYSYLKKRYTYLQVPLVLGYDFWQNKWLSFGVRAGATMSLLLKSENITSAYDPGKDRVVSINDISPDRIHLNWQAMGGLNTTFLLSRRFSIEIEPELRYYFNSVYESSEITKKPWSVGIRSAFLIIF